MSTPYGHSPDPSQPPTQGSSGYSAGYSAGYATAPPPGQAAPTAEPYGPPPVGYGQAPPASPPPPARNPGATIGWVGFALAFLLGFIGIVLGTISINRSRAVGASIRVGVAAVVVGVLQVLAVIVAVLLALIVQLTGDQTRPNPGDVDQEQTVLVTELEPGTCMDVSTVDETSVLAVPCAQPHDGEVISQSLRSGTAYPGEDQLYDEAIDSCHGPVSSAISPRTNTENLYVDAFVPTQQEWDAGSRLVSCLLVSDGAMTGSATAGDLIAPVG